MSDIQNFPEGEAGLIAEIDHFVADCERWMKQDIDEENQGLVADLKITGVALNKKLDTEKERQKRPHLDANSAIEKVFKPRYAKIEGPLAKIKAKLNAYMDALDRKRKVAAEEARQAALEENRKAEEATREAAADDPFEQFDAADQARKAQEQQQAADAAAEIAAKRVNVASASGAGKALSTRLYWDVTVVDGPALVTHYAHSMTLIEEARKIAQAQVRAAKGAHNIPGIVVTERREVV